MLAVVVSNPQTSQQARAPAGQAASSRTGAQAQQRRARPDPTDAETLRQSYLNSPADLANLRHQLPLLGDAINDQARFKELWDEFQKRQKELQAQKERDIALLEADPFDVDAQRRIEELIRLERVDENLEQTREYHPEGMCALACLPKKLSDAENHT